MYSKRKRHVNKKPRKSCKRHKSSKSRKISRHFRKRMFRKHSHGGGLDVPTVGIPSYNVGDYTEMSARDHLFVGPLQDRIVYLYSRNEKRNDTLVVLGVYSVALDRMVFFAACRENINILLPSRLVYLKFPDGVDFLGTLASTVSLNCNLFFFTEIDQNLYTLNNIYAYKNYISDTDPNSIKQNIPRRVQRQERDIEYDNEAFSYSPPIASYTFITLRPEDFDNPRQLALEYFETEGSPYLSKIGIRQGKARFSLIEALVNKAPERLKYLQHNFSTFLFELQSNGIFKLNSFTSVINHRDTYINVENWLQVYQDICRSPTTVGNISMFQRLDDPAIVQDNNVMKKAVISAIYACSLWFKRIGCRVQQLYHQNAPEINSIPILKSMSDVASCINSLLPNQYELFQASNPIKPPSVEQYVSRDTFKPPLMSISALEKEKLPDRDARFYRHVFIQNADGDIIIKFNKKQKIVCSLPNVGAVLADGDGVVFGTQETAMFISDVFPIQDKISDILKEEMKKKIQDIPSKELIRKRDPEAAIYMTELSMFPLFSIQESNFQVLSNYREDFNIHLEDIFKYGDSTRILSYYALLPDSYQMKFIIYKEPLLYFTGHTKQGVHATAYYSKRYYNYEEIESRFVGDPQYNRHPQFISSPDVPDMIRRSVADAASAVPGVENNYYIDYMSEYGVEVQDDVYTANAGSENLFEARGKYLEISGDRIQENFNMPTLRISRFTPDAVKLYKNLMLEGHVNQMLYAIGQVLSAQGLI